MYSGEEWHIMTSVCLWPFRRAPCTTTQVILLCWTSVTIWWNSEYSCKWHNISTNQKTSTSTECNSGYLATQGLGLGALMQLFYFTWVDILMFVQFTFAYDINCHFHLTKVNHFQSLAFSFNHSSEYRLLQKPPASQYRHHCCIQAPISSGDNWLNQNWPSGLGVMTSYEFSWPLSVPLIVLDCLENQPL